MQRKHKLDAVFVRDSAFYRQLLQIALPIAAQNLIAQGIQIMDTVMLGRLGDAAVSGVSSANQIFFVYNLFIFGITAGAAVLCAQYWGSGDKTAVRKVMAIALRISLAVGLFFFLAVSFFPEFLLRIYTNDSDVIREGMSYLKVVSPIYLTTAFSSAYMLLIRSTKNVTISLIANISSFFLNVFFNYVFIFGTFGAPRLEARGAAVGTLIARLAELVLMLVYCSFIEKKLGFRLKDLFAFDSALFKRFLRYSLPVVFNESLWGLGSSMSVALLGQIGKEVITANAIASNVLQMLTVLIFGIANAALVIVGAEIGAGKISYAKKCCRTFEVLAVVIGLLLSLTLFLITEPALSLFSVEAESIEIARCFLYILVFITPFQCYNATTIVGLFRAGGDTKFCFVCDVTALWAYALPTAAIMIFGFGLPPVVVYFAIRLEEFFKSFVAFTRLRQDRWIRQVTVHSEQEILAEPMQN